MLKSGSLLLKRVAAAKGDRVCNDGHTVFVNDVGIASLMDNTHVNHPATSVSECHVLASDEVLLLGNHEASFDSRYFGPVSAKLILGKIEPVLLVR